MANVAHFLGPGRHVFNTPAFTFKGFKNASTDYVNLHSKHRVRDFKTDTNANCSVPAKALRVLSSSLPESNAFIETYGSCLARLEQLPCSFQAYSRGVGP